MSKYYEIRKFKKNELSGKEKSPKLTLWKLEVSLLAKFILSASFSKIFFMKMPDKFPKENQKTQY